MKFKISCLYFVKLMICLIFCLIGNVYAEKPLILAVHPFLSNEELEKKFTPVANYLSAQTGMNIQVKIGSNYDEHIRFIGLDKVDIAYMGPASYVIMKRKFGAKPLLAKLEVNGQAYFEGNIIVRSDSGIKTMKDLQNKRFAFGDPNSTMSYIVPHHMLHQADVFTGSNVKHEFLYSHINVALGVLSGDYDAGAVKPEIFRKYEAEGLRSIAMTPKVSEHLFITSSTLAAHKVEALRKAMLNMNNTAEGLEALKSIKTGISAVVPVNADDYDNLTRIFIESEVLH